MPSNAHRADSKARRILTYSLAGLIALLVVVVAATAIMGPAYRTKLLGAWGYEHLTTLNQKIAMINDSALGTTGVDLAIGSDLMPIPFTDETLSIQSVSPAVGLSLSRGDVSSNLQPNADGTWTYVSAAYQIKLTITSDVMPGGPLPQVRLRVRAEAAK